MADEWSIQHPPEEGTAFLLHNGVLVGRLYGGAPINDMVRLLNGTIMDQGPFERAALHHEIGAHDGSGHPYEFCARCEMEHPDGKFQVALSVIRQLHDGGEPKGMTEVEQAILASALAQRDT